MADEKTEQPTDKKLRDARRDGETVKSTDLPFAAILLVASIGFTVAGPRMAEQLRLLMHRSLDVARMESPGVQLHDLLVEAGTVALMLILPIALGAAITGLAALAAQVGLQISTKPLEPKFDAINPASGLKRIFSVRSLIDLAKTVIKAVVISAVLWKMIVLLMPLMIGIVYEPIGSIDGIGWATLCKVFGIAGALYLVIGAVDYGVQRWLFIRDHRMSKDEVKREHKNSEGDPHIKNERRKIAREFASSDRQQPVKNANVVVVNPTHYAVALRYVPSECGLPRVIAKGVDADARVIREEAARRGIPIIGNPPLARALYRVTLDDSIPEPLFDAVAAVLAWVENIGGRRSDADAII
ncbi:type III secretion system export apparatus subunit SctU [Paraburkholderia rhynchosiae]|uniref:EscU/YscU/HrcU family type III secretion system export apparatus switch protein n=1 Tax=Paraburkholderia rhynchosiae TaxID=487049 RepID=A0A2N7W648_9BURK|nr:type III secretion system export apparatus subunit SctU [Paraburkholderia rhynchosiae]PMS24859.1 EscU/YscU/HrcU family type III secretion system export apparatus switch protein [Paraburkholderia rhynchosiae]CAB3725583.1 Yop proteins translocation protein U [Paraburkholderia rhynchosiae]